MSKFKVFVFLLPVFLGFSLSYSQFTPDFNTVALWHIDRINNGSIIYDASGKNHHGTFVLPKYSKGKFGECADFVNRNEKINIPDHNDLKLTKSFSLEAWAYIRGFPSNSGIIGIILFRGDNRYAMDPYYLGTNSQGKITFHIEDSLGNMVNLVSSNAAPTNQWIYIAGTLNDTTGAMKLYINGALSSELITTKRPFSNLDVSSLPGLGIGSHPFFYNVHSIDGMVDEVRISNIVRSPEEISDAWQPPLVYYPKSISPIPSSFVLSPSEKLVLSFSLDKRMKTDSILFCYNHLNLVSAENYPASTGVSYNVSSKGTILKTVTNCKDTIRQPLKIFLTNAEATSDIFVAFEYLGGVDEVIILSPYLKVYGKLVDLPTSILRPLAPSTFSLQKTNNQLNTNPQLSYAIPRSGQVHVRVVDLNGKVINTLFNGYQQAGIYSKEWNKLDNTGKKVHAGTYLFQVRYENNMLAHREIIMHGLH